MGRQLSRKARTASSGEAEAALGATSSVPWRDDVKQWKERKIKRDLLEMKTRRNWKNLEKIIRKWWPSQITETKTMRDHFSQIKGCGSFLVCWEIKISSSQNRRLKNRCTARYAITKFKIIWSGEKLQSFCEEKKNEFYSNFEDSEFLQRFQVPQMMVLAFTPPRKSSLDAVKFDSCSKHCSFIREEMSK